MLPKISIIIPYYNHRNSLEFALESVVMQTYSNKEVIIVDDGSDTPLESVTSDYMDKLDARILRQENRGAPSARNMGLSHSTGEYVIFWDADVVAVPEMLTELESTLSSHPEAVFSYSHYMFGQHRMPAKEFDIVELRKNNYIHSTTLIRKNACPSWDESLGRFQDWDLWLQIVDGGGKGVLVPEYLFEVMPNRSGISRWMPSFFYKYPFRLLPVIRKQVCSYEEAKQIVMSKHHIT
jgi:glycosyltransferase involved in cell wall biosynthesis